MTRLVRQRHDLYHEVCAERGESAAHLADLARLKDWAVTTPCANHDRQNALKWALRGIGSEVEVIKRLHVSIAALRNAYDLLYASLTDFLSQTLYFVDGDVSLRGPLYRFWIGLGLESGVADLAADLQLLWRSDRLEVTNARRNDAQLTETVSRIMLTVCKFKSFTDSRWLTVGDSSKSLVASLCLGLSR